MKLFDVVALLDDLPAKNLSKGQVGTIIEELDAENVFVEFSDVNGRTYAQEPLHISKLMELKHAPVLAA